MNRSPFGTRVMLATIAMGLCLSSFTPLASASTDSDTAREQAKQILTDKKYGRDETNPLNKDVDRLNDWLGGKKKKTVKERNEQQVRKSYNPPSGHINPPGLGAVGGAMVYFLYLFVALVIAGIGYVIYLIVKNIKQSKKHEKVVEEIETLDIDWKDEEKVIEHITDADQLEALSIKAEQEGHFDIALRYRFRAGLLRLDNIHAISFHPSITNNQWQQEINSELFNLLTRDFNDVTYGHRTCDVTQLDRARENWALLINERKAS